MNPSSPLKPAAWERRIAVAGALLAVAVVALKRGRQHPDEVFQFLEPAHGLAFGYWLVAWAWVEGLRNWAVPGCSGGSSRCAGGWGLEHPWALASVVWVCCAAVQAWGAVQAWDTGALFRLVEGAGWARSRAPGGGRPRHLGRVGSSMPRGPWRTR